MLPQTERYLDLGREGKSHWSRYVAGIFLIAAAWVALGMLPYGWAASTLELGPMLDFVAINLTIVAMLAGLAAAMRLLHRRPLMTLIAPAGGIAWRRVGQGAGAWAALLLVFLGVEHALHPDRYVLTFDAARFFAFAPLVLLMTPIQTTTEELVFRGYVMQALASVVGRPAVVAVLSAAFFTLPHLFNPEMHYGPWLLAATYFTIGLLLAVITLRDGRLELAIGVHAANNLMLALVANYEYSALQTESILTARELDPVFSFVALAASAGAVYWWFFGRGLPAVRSGNG